MRSIEHGNLIDEASARLMAENGAFLVPTLVDLRPDRRAREIASIFAEVMPAQAQRTCLDARLHAMRDRAGRGRARSGFGTDLLGETHAAQSKELALRAKVQSNADVLRAATVVNAELLQHTGKLGVLAPGAFADLLIVDGNPLDDLGVLDGQGERIALIMRGGTVFKNALN